jgi:DNA-binding transcriptional LysR family regulator
MKRLQEEIGVPIFRRQGRKMLLTEQGEIALRYARRVLALSDEMVDTLRGSSMSGVVRVGFVQDFTDNSCHLQSNGSAPSIRLSNLR